MKHYHIWPIGCQMNEADSGRVAAELDALGYTPTDSPKNADVIVLNTCVVRQGPEDRAVGHLWSLKPLKDRDPNRVIALMGCMVGIKPNRMLQERFPFVDVFMPPSNPSPLVGFLTDRDVRAQARELQDEEIQFRHPWLPVLPARPACGTRARQAHVPEDRGSPEAAALGLIDDGGPLEPAPPLGQPLISLQHQAAEVFPLQSLRHLSLHGQAPVAANVPVVYGCSHACTFCIIPLRRGGERSRPLAEIVTEVRGLVEQGVREVTLLGQIVDRYGKDHPEQRPDLADLLTSVHEIDGLRRIRFLTSHPNYLTDRILAAVASLPKVCEQIEVPVQAGDDAVLQRMKRGYSRADYYRLVQHIREVIPSAAIHTDVIVGFPGETSEQFQRTYELLAELKPDKAHLAIYSPRPGTASARHMTDDVSQDEKKRRWDALDALQAKTAGEINRGVLGQTVEVLVEDLHKGKWRGRTRTGKLVFYQDPGKWRGQLAQVRITWAGPWSMIGELDPEASGACGGQTPSADHLAR